MGIVGDVRQVSLDQERQMQAYLPDARVPLSGFTLVVRGAGNLAKSVRDTIRGFDRNQPVYDIATMEERIAVTVAQRRLALILLALFAGLALVLAVVGVYGLMAYLVGLRRREFGIRAALGASRSQTAGWNVHLPAVAGSFRRRGKCEIICFARRARTAGHGRDIKDRLGS